MTKRLYRSKTNEVFAGVCGGLGEYLNIDPVIIRLIWIATIFAGGTGILLYIIAIFVIPEEDEVSRQAKQNSEDVIIENENGERIHTSSMNEKDKKTITLLGAIFLIVIGILLFMNVLGPLHGIVWFSSKIVFAVILILAGIYIMTKSGKHR
ncbi:MAG TPA: PspC domain-containing protein [Tepiditoga sp.]|nr:PspC domain-containing protein [Tepiditoga sp.]